MAEHQVDQTRVKRSCPAVVAQLDFDGKRAARYHLVCVGPLRKCKAISEPALDFLQTAACGQTVEHIGVIVRIQIRPVELSQLCHCGSTL